MLKNKMTVAAEDLWQQMFQRMASREDASVWDPEYDPAEDTDRLRAALLNAGWTSDEIEERIKVENTRITNFEDLNPKVSPHAQIIYKQICADIESAMLRLKMESYSSVAHGIEPRIGPFASKTNVIMTDQSIITVGVHLFRYCGLIARAFTRTLHVNPYFWDSNAFSKEEAKAYIIKNQNIMKYWFDIYLSYASTGTNALVPFAPAAKHEVLLFEQIARAMEIFATAHEYGHHEYNHGRSIDYNDAHAEEFEADQFALRIGREVEKYPLIMPNPYLYSGAGGIILLMSMETLRRVEFLICKDQPTESSTHPKISDRIAKFNTQSVLQPREYAQMSNFRLASTRIMENMEEILLHSIGGLDFRKLRELSTWKFEET